MTSVFRMPDRDYDPEPELPLIDNPVARAIRTALKPSSILRYKSVVIATFAAIAALSVVYLAFRPATYVATSTILVASAANPNDLRDVITAGGEVNEFRYKQFAAQIRISRLRAELTDAETFAYTGDLGSSADRALLEEAISREQLLFASRKKTLQDEILNTEQTLALFEAEVGSLTQQVTYAAQQQDSVDTEVADLRSLVDKGLTPITRLRDQERSSAALASRKVEIEAELLGRKQSVVESRQKITEIQNERRTEILSDLQEAESEMRVAQARLAAAESVRSSLHFSRIVDDNAVADQMSLLHSDEIALQVVQAGDLANDEFISGSGAALLSFGGGSAEEVDPAAPSKQDLAVKALQRNLEVTRVGRGSEIAIAFRSPDPAKAALIANAVAMIYTNPNSNIVETGVPGTGPSVTNGQIIQRAVPEPDSPSAVKVLALVLFVGSMLSLFGGFGVAFLRALLDEMRASRSLRFGRN